MHYQKLRDDERNGVITPLSELDAMGAKIVYGNPLNANLWKEIDD